MLSLALFNGTSEGRWGSFVRTGPDWRYRIHILSSLTGIAITRTPSHARVKPFRSNRRMRYM